MTLLAGRYRLDHPIGRGGMAVVHRADDEVLHRPVAVKTLVPARVADSSYRAAVHREAINTARLNHPHVARLLDYGEDDWQGVTLPFLVMELITGKTLHEHLRQQGPMPWREAATVCAEIAGALAAAHRKNLVHHDIKPANVMLSPDGVKLLDFGVASAAGEAPRDQDGRILGTPAYLSPEQLWGQPTGPAADVYALGLVLHACLIGHQAWSGRTVQEVLIARACTPDPRIAPPAALPSDLHSLYRACLVRSPQRRPTAAEIAKELNRVADRSPAAPHRVGAGRLAALTARLTGHRPQRRRGDRGEEQGRRSNDVPARSSVRESDSTATSC